MLTAEKLISILREGNQFCAHGMYTNEAGLAFFSGYSIRTLRAWRETWREIYAPAERKGPRPQLTPRVFYDLEEIVSWWGRSSGGTTNDRRQSAGTGSHRQKAESSA